jgi:hypothetical protein
MNFLKFTIITLLFIQFNAHSQQKAITENGEEVWLNEDGTWSYVNAVKEEEKTIAFNAKTFVKPVTSTFLLKSKKLNIGVYFDPKKWKTEKSEVSSETEYSFQLKTGDLYAMLITEQIEIPLETLKNAAFTNAKMLLLIFEL